jgi:hypothetical protein
MREGTMSDHSHWWSFVFKADGPNRVFFFLTQLPCGVEDKVIGAKMAEIIADNSETFGGKGAGKCVPSPMPDEVVPPKSVQNRLCTQDELLAAIGSGGRPS